MDKIKRKKLPINKKLERILKERELDLKRYHFIPIEEPRDLSNEEIEKNVADLKAQIYIWMDSYVRRNKYHEALPELKKRRHSMRDLSNTEYFCTLAEATNLLMDYKFVKNEITKQKRELTKFVQYNELCIYRENLDSQQKLDLIVPRCLETLEEEYYKAYDILNKKTTLIKKGEKKAEEEVELIQKRYKEGYYNNQ